MATIDNQMDLKEKSGKSPNDTGKLPSAAKEILPGTTKQQEELEDVSAKEAVNGDNQKDSSPPADSSQSPTMTQSQFDNFYGVHILHYNTKQLPKQKEHTTTYIDAVLQASFRVQTLLKQNINEAQQNFNKHPKQTLLKRVVSYLQDTLQTWSDTSAQMTKLRSQMLELARVNGYGFEPHHGMTSLQNLNADYRGVLCTMFYLTLEDEHDLKSMIKNRSSAWTYSWLGSLTSSTQSFQENSVITSQKLLRRVTGYKNLFEFSNLLAQDRIQSYPQGSLSLFSQNIDMLNDPIIKQLDLRDFFEVMGHQYRSSFRMFYQGMVNLSASHHVATSVSGNYLGRKTVTGAMMGYYYLCKGDAAEKTIDFFRNITAEKARSLWNMQNDPMFRPFIFMWFPHIRHSFRVEIPMKAVEHKGENEEKVAEDGQVGGKKKIIEIVEEDEVVESGDTEGNESESKVIEGDAKAIIEGDAKREIDAKPEVVEGDADPKVIVESTEVDPKASVEGDADSNTPEIEMDSKPSDTVTPTDIVQGESKPSNQGDSKPSDVVESESKTNADPTEGPSPSDTISPSSDPISPSDITVTVSKKILDNNGCIPIEEATEHRQKSLNILKGYNKSTIKVRLLYDGMNKDITKSFTQRHYDYKPLRSLLGIGYTSYKKKAKAQQRNIDVSGCMMVHFHGGGFVAMTTKGHENYLRLWARDLHIPIISVEYTLAPHLRYPSQPHECFEAYKWALENAETILGTKLRKVFVGGDSAGGNLTLSVLNHAIHDKIRIPDAAIITYPASNPNPTPSPARLLSVLDPLVNLGLMKLCSDLYEEPGSDNTRDPFFAPIVTPPEYLKQYPPTYINVGTLDPLFDDAIAMAKKISHFNGGRVKLTILDGYGHGYLNCVDFCREAVDVSDTMVDWMLDFIEFTDNGVMKQMEEKMLKVKKELDEKVEQRKKEEREDGQEDGNQDGENGEDVQGEENQKEKSGEKEENQENVDVPEIEKPQQIEVSDCAKQPDHITENRSQPVLHSPIISEDLNNQQEGQSLLSADIEPIPTSPATTTPNLQSQLPSTQDDGKLLE